MRRYVRAPAPTLDLVPPRPYTIMLNTLWLSFLGGDPLRLEVPLPSLPPTTCLLANAGAYSEANLIGMLGSRFSGLSQPLALEGAEGAAGTSKKPVSRVVMRMFEVRVAVSSRRSE